MSTVNSSLMRARWAAVGAAVAVSLGGGAIFVANAATGDVVSESFVAIEPCRLNDTRGWGQTDTENYPIDPVLGAGSDNQVTIDLQGSDLGYCKSALTLAPGVTLNALVMNVTVTGTTAASHLTIWPNGGNRPENLSSLNWVAGQTIANSVTVKVGTSNRIKIFNNAGTTEFILDLVGYYTNPPA